jgi:hypothetical protein
MMPRQFPRYIPYNPTVEESAAYLADLLEWLVSKRLPDLREAGFTDADLFTLRRLAKDFRSGALSPASYQALYALLDKLESAGTWA